MENVAERIERYFQEEGFTQRSEAQVLEEIEKSIGKIGLDSVLKVFGEDNDGDNGQLRFYEAASTPVGKSCVYDFFKSRHYSSALWKVVEASRELAEADAKTILDVGCASGLEACFIAEALEANGHVYGIDISLGMIARAYERARRRGLRNVSFRNGSRDNLPFPEGYFDAAILMHSLTEGNNREHHPQDQIFNNMAIYDRLQGIKKVLKPQGLLLVSEPSSPDFEDYTRDYSGGRIEGAGFEIADTRVHRFESDGKERSSVFFVAHR